MSDHSSGLRDLPDLAREVRERALTPPYDEVSRRVRARRLRGAIASITVAVAVVGGLAVWQSLATTAGPGPGPVDQTPLPPTDESLWRAVVEGTDAHPFEIDGTSDGSIAVVWRALEQPEPTFALVVREADGTVHGRRLDEPVDLTPAPGGWVGTHSSRAWFINSGGQWTALPRPTAPRAARAGDVFVRGQYASWLYSPADRSLAAVALPGDTDGYVSPDGVLATCQSNGRDEIFFSPSDRMRPGVPGRTCVIAGNGDDLAVVGLGDDPDGGIPMTGLMMRIDGTWLRPRMTAMLDGVTSVVVTPGGRTVITDASTGDWYLIGADGRFLPTDRKVGEAFVAGDRLYVTSYGFMNAPVAWSDDEGHTWHEDVLPGNESSEE